MINDLISFNKVNYKNYMQSIKKKHYLALLIFIIPSVLFLIWVSISIILQVDYLNMFWKMFIGMVLFILVVVGDKISQNKLQLYHNQVIEHLRILLEDKLKKEMINLKPNDIKELSAVSQRRLLKERKNYVISPAYVSIVLSIVFFFKPGNNDDIYMMVGIIGIFLSVYLLTQAIFKIIEIMHNGNLERNKLLIELLDDIYIKLLVESRNIVTSEAKHNKDIALAEDTFNVPIEVLNDVELEKELKKN